MKPKTIISFILISSLVSCTNKIFRERIHEYLNASDTTQKSKYMAPGFRSYFAENGKGDGKPKEQVLASLMQWDGPMHPDIPIQSFSRHGNMCTVYFVEQNDFSKLIGYPGWKGKAEFSFDSKKMIAEYIYYPDSTNASYRPYLKPAVDWLEKTHPDELTTVYQNRRLIQNEKAARLWIKLLTEWKTQSH